MPTRNGIFGVQLNIDDDDLIEIGSTDEAQSSKKAAPKRRGKRADKAKAAPSTEEPQAGPLSAGAADKTPKPRKTRASTKSRKGATSKKGSTADKPIELDNVDELDADTSILMNVDQIVDQLRPSPAALLAPGNPSSGTTSPSPAPPATTSSSSTPAPRPSAVAKGKKPVKPHPLSARQKLERHKQLSTNLGRAAWIGLEEDPSMTVAEAKKKINELWVAGNGEPSLEDDHMRALWAQRYDDKAALKSHQIAMIEVMSRAAGPWTTDGSEPANELADDMQNVTVSDAPSLDAPSLDSLSQLMPLPSAYQSQVATGSTPEMDPMPVDDTQTPGAPSDMDIESSADEGLLGKHDRSPQQDAARKRARRGSRSVASGSPQPSASQAGRPTARRGRLGRGMGMSFADLPPLFQEGSSSTRPARPAAVRANIALARNPDLSSDDEDREV